MLNYKQVELKREKMNEISYVVVFPSIFSKNKIPQLIKNIKKILKIKNQKYSSVKRDGDIILVNANDPVFASSAINLLFGIKKIAIARQVKNDFQNIISEITSIGGNLLLKGEKFLVKVEGISKGFLVKDIEIAATSNIIEKKSNLGAHPGTDENFDKLLYTYLTKNNAYICIFSDKGKGGIPYQSQNQQTICSIYDEISAVSCYETIKQGHNTKIIICYRQKSELMNLSKIINQIIPRLVQEKIGLEFYHLKTDRINFKGDTNSLKKLNEFQEKALIEIKDAFLQKDVTLLHGITSSGKTEVYTKLIQEILDKGQQVLFLLPEIALTTQIITRLQAYFGKQISVFHSKYSMNERVEVWNNVLENKSKAQIILGARSSLFLPFSNLGLIVVDEEHETSYKQFEPNPRYNARDAAIVLAKMHLAKILLGSATPSLESYFNAQQNKYGFVELNRRFGNVQLPKIELIDIKEKHRKKEMKGHFSDKLLVLIQEALDEKEQIILFQNRRGFSPIVECKTCGVSPQCPNCDISLTYHKYKNELRCHYCNYQRAMPNNCSACGSNTLDTKGFGTEQIELELKELFPDYSIGRMDLDTTRGKFGYQKIIGAFEAREIDILVGTQMLSKGLDFDNVSLVGILNADTMLNFPDFRAHERAYQLMVQVSGRAGRSKKQGNVAIQTYNPYHQILQQVSTTDYQAMFKEQLQERWQFKYPPYYRLIKITLKHRDYTKVDSGINWLFKALYNSFGEHVLGPTAPVVARIRNQYIKNVVIKIPPKQSLANTKNQIQKIKNTFEAVKEFRPIRFIIDVDAY